MSTFEISPKREPPPPPGLATDNKIPGLCQRQDQGWLRENMIGAPGPLPLLTNSPDCSFVDSAASSDLPLLHSQSLK